MNRSNYFWTGLLLVIVGGVLGGWFYTLDAGNFNYTLTLGPAQTQIYISTSTTFYSIAIFVCGAVFSTGLSMIFTLLQSSPEKGKK